MSLKELVVNKPLSGTELKELIRQDVAATLDMDGILSSQMAFGRVSYTVSIKLHLDNPSFPESEVAPAQSRPAPPLANPSPESVVRGRTRTRTITSPNASRVAAGMPITVTSRDQDGHMKDRLVRYAPVEAGLRAEDIPTPTDEEISREALELEWKLGQPVISKIPDPFADVPAPKPQPIPSPDAAVRAAELELTRQGIETTVRRNGLEDAVEVVEVPDGQA